mmetsp:Transcript_15400/g.25439  ORF Transcript_15400/g.25439 Transcript_15400/m.25439 type:complete len:454 (+) Transcript_15400:233-1594(+)|eukprot:CAMPEP_0184658858 /NCGR_PEP_ID=MMETSP0308-20130426/27172_1 /TAXON_ID=38269 /ORGANISM="Gloeochaete witrockiana, Strain SAG 46.84" /LENGTH=453 /DNA_ID=CAMNT_0027098185 /DNA_START=145 /DNA_END=1506 /DNA_ORIENTATION=-
MPIATGNFDAYECGELRTLGKPGDGEAKAILKKVSNQVKPIMRKRKWRVGICREFFPPNANLLGLNVNGGAEICLRLRPHWAGERSEFLAYDQILGTMLHELAHIARGPHDQEFYRILDELQAECDGLISKGIHGGEFDGVGRKLSGTTHNPRSMSAARDLAAKAAEKRLVTNVGARRLGGEAPVRSPAEMAARAAERRRRDNETCGNRDDAADGGGVGGSTGNSSSGILLVDDAPDRVEEIQKGPVARGGEVEKRRLLNGRADREVLIDVERRNSMTMKNGSEGASASASALAAENRKGGHVLKERDDKNNNDSRIVFGESTKSNRTVSSDRKEGRSLPKSYSNSSGSGSLSSSGVRQSSLVGRDIDISQTSPWAKKDDDVIMLDEDSADMWRCSVCTLVNEGSSPLCDACGTATVIPSRQPWTCAKCTFVNVCDARKCDICGAIRHITDVH